jgi:PHD/YefM family antitoxin component YafN of YafNO toxin-antitoxin module
MAAQQFVVNAKGKKTGVILSLKQYERLMEDIHDITVIAERRSEKTISLEELKRRLKRDGLL